MENEDAIEASFRDIAQTLKLEFESSCSETVKRYLSICSDQLLILDNADDPNLKVTRYLPSRGRGAVIITTRNRGNQVYAPGQHANHEVGDMMKEDAVALLLKAAQMDPETPDTALQEHARLVASELGFLALAIDQAGCYIAARNHSLQRYIEDYRKNRGSLPGEQVSARESRVYQRTAYTTWNMSFEAVKSTSLLASSLLLHFSFLHYEKIPIELFRRASDDLDIKSSSLAGFGILEPILGSLLERNGGKWDGFQFESAISTLRKFSLVKHDGRDDESIYSIHPLVHSWARERLVQEQLGTKMSVGCLLSHSICSAHGNSSDDHKFQTRLFLHVDSFLRFIPELEDSQEQCCLEIMPCLSVVFGEAGSYATQEHLLKRAVDIGKTMSGPECPSTLTSTNNLASTYMSQGKWSETEILQVEVLEVQKRILGPEHPNTLTSMNNFALTSHEQGKWTEAEVLQVEVLEVQKRIIGLDHLDTLTSMNDLALTYSKQGKWDEAEALQVEVLKVRKRIVGPEHPNTLLSMSNLASTYREQGKWNEAEVLRWRCWRYGRG